MDSKRHFAGGLLRLLYFSLRAKKTFNKMIEIGESSCCFVLLFHVLDSFIPQVAEDYEDLGLESKKNEDVMTEITLQAESHVWLNRLHSENMTCIKYK